MQHEVTCHKLEWQPLPSRRRAFENHLANLAVQCKLLKVYYDLRDNHYIFLEKS